MGSIPSTPPPVPPETNLSRYHVYAVFCSREPGPTCNQIEFYNPTDNTWSFVSCIPGLVDNHVLKDFSMVSLRDSIFIVGGRMCRKERARDTSGLDDYFDEHDIEVRATVLRYNIRSDEWSECAPLSIPRFSFACTVVNGKIFVAGGQSTLNSAKGVSSAEMYDPVCDEWVPLPDMSTFRYKCVGLAWLGRVVVVGGFVAGEDSSKIVSYVERSSAEVYDDVSGRWGRIPGMWQLDVPPNQIVAVNTKLFSSGDCLNAWKGHIEAYDMKVNIWNIVDGSQLRIPTGPAQRFYLTMAPIGDQLYFLAGHRTAEESSMTRSTVYVFDTSEGTWRSKEPIEVEGEKELCSHGCVVQLSDDFE